MNSEKFQRLNAINGIIIEKVHPIEEKKTKTKNSGELVIDATCIPADITYPQDTKLLNRCREETEKIIDEVCKTNKIKKPRMKR
ncbi:MAG: hypothetical protein NTX05_00060 [Fusobacteria bacterium]|nr:hypothetical protein [Fusobacteriota bacterium]